MVSRAVVYSVRENDLDLPLAQFSLSVDSIPSPMAKVIIMVQPMRRVSMKVDRSDVDWLFEDLVKGDLEGRDTVSPSESQSVWITANRFRVKLGR